MAPFEARALQCGGCGAAISRARCQTTHLTWEAMADLVARYKWLLVCLAIVLFLYGASVRAIVLPFDLGNECLRNAVAGEKYCSTYGLASIAFERMFAFLDSNGSAVSALATLVIASFTATLWWSTRRLWVTSSRSADAAERAIVEARRIGEAQVRAYLGIEAISLEPYRHSNDSAGKYRINFRIRNFGQSMAKDVKSRTECFESDVRLNSRIDKKETDYLDHIYGIINPNHSPPGIIDIGEIVNINKIRVKFELLYEDVFCKKWEQVAEYHPVPSDDADGTFNMNVFPNTAAERCIEAANRASASPLTRPPRRAAAHGELEG